MITLLVLAALFVAFANGANDNFKGVATLFGTAATSYRGALAWATLTTLAGSLASLVAGGALVKSFSGKGLVPQNLTTDLHFLVAVGGGAAFAVLVATLIGMPVSTTHSLLGGLIGAGLMAAGSHVDFAALGRNFVSPLLLSPILSILLTWVVYTSLRAVRRFVRIETETCLCVGEAHDLVDLRADGSAVLRSTGVILSTGELSQCRTRYTGHVFGISAQRVLVSLHFVSAGAVSFARGLNDTPKIVALLLAAGLAAHPGWSLSTTAVMAMGGLLGAKRVAETMSHRITAMNEGQGFSANLATALLVILASALGLPVSTTHVSVGALFGLGLANRRANPRQVISILTAWVTTLPMAGALAALLYWGVTRFAQVTP